ncbi:MAG: hypothetical protein ACXVCD_19085 [Pseudobdellovibrionaceae bacterium]
MLNKLLTLSAVFFLSLCLVSQSFGALAAQLFLDGEEKNVMTAGAPTNLKIEIFNTDSPDPLHHFHPMHEKEMHLILVSEDLESFAHLHPQHLSEHLGLFGIDINQPTQDPYNLDAPTAVRKPGPYFLFAESMPMGFSMTTLALDFTALGAVTPKKPLELDAISPDGFIYKNFNAYSVKLKVKTFPNCGTFSVLLEAELRHWDPLSQTYTEVLDLQPWLSSFAHTVLISEEGNNAQEKKFLHLHAVWPLVDDPNTERGPYLRVGSDSHAPMREGVFKAWLQFKHLDQVQTIPFVIELKAPLAPVTYHCSELF